jgi:CubicO group peptidase (beta-lactamase class C family)
MPELIDGLVQSAQNNGMELYGVHVYRRGEEPVERRLRSDDRENLWSVSKTFVSVALGIAEAEGRLALDDPALKYYPELKGAARPGPGTGHAPPSVDDDIREPAFLVRRRAGRGPRPGGGLLRDPPRA